VSDIACGLGLSLSLASQSLRVLNARGLLLAARNGSAVYYRPGANSAIPFSTNLLNAIQMTFRNDEGSTEKIFQYCTAFTHPRRIHVIKVLSGRPMQFRELALKTRISLHALRRHLRKLSARGFIKRNAGGYYRISVPHHNFARLLLRLARGA